MLILETRENELLCQHVFENIEAEDSARTCYLCYEMYSKYLFKLHMVAILYKMDFRESKAWKKKL